MNRSLNISNQPLQLSKNSTTTPWGLVTPGSSATSPKLTAARAGLVAGLVRHRPGAPAAALTLQHHGGLAAPGSPAAGLMHRRPRAPVAALARLAASSCAAYDARHITRRHREEEDEPHGDACGGLGEVAIGRVGEEWEGNGMGEAPSPRPRSVFFHYT
jgi:hypothetical protein